MKIPQRLQEALAPLLDAARERNWSLLWEGLQEIFLVEAGDRYDALLQSLRSEGLLEAWRFCWEQGLELAGYKVTMDDVGFQLLAVRLTPVWRGSCTAADRKTLTRALQAPGVFPKRGRLTWFPSPQPLPGLLEVSPLLWWKLNTPKALLPGAWQYQRRALPVPYLLLGRLEAPLSAGGISWPDPDSLAEALGWPSGSIDAAGPLVDFLRLVEEEEERSPLELLAQEIAGKAVAWCQAQGAEVRSCRALLEAAAHDRYVLFVKAPGGEKTQLAEIRTGNLLVPWEDFTTALQAACAEVGLLLLTEQIGAPPAGGRTIH